MELTRLTRSLSRFEMALTILIIVILIAYGINRMLVIAVDAERVGIDVILRNMRSNLNLFMAQKIISGDNQAFVDLEHKNPVGIIFDAPAGYIGEVAADEISKIKPGQWYYDKSNQYLIYQVINTTEFKSDLSGPARLRLQLKLNFTDNNANGVFDGGIDTARGLSLVSPDSYTWLR